MVLKICKYLSFGFVALLTVYMAVASVLEKFHGTDAVMKWAYHSPVFIAMWALAAASGIVYVYFRLVKGRAFRDIPLSTACIHLSFILILAGALTTHLSGDSGAVHFRKGDPAATAFVREDGSMSELPFSVSLSDFKVEYYPGSDAPKDYISTLHIMPGEVNGGEGVRHGTEGISATVSMNRIFRYGGYRFYQASYDDDGGGSTIAVSHDPAGVAVTYAGYALLLLSMTGFFFRRDSGFRAALRRLCGSAAAAVPVILCLVLSSADASASPKNGTELPKHLPEDVASEYGRIFVYYNDRVCPMQTLARDFTMKLYGRPSWRGLTCEQVLTGWIFYADQWYGTLDMDGSQSSQKAAMKARDREESIRLVCTGSLLRIFPFTCDGKVSWYSSVDRLPAEMDPAQWLFVRKVMSLAGEGLMKKDFDGVKGIFAKIREHQLKSAPDVIPSVGRVRAEIIYNSIDRPKALAMACLSAGLLLFVFFCISGHLRGSASSCPAPSAGDRRVSRRPLHTVICSAAHLLSALLLLYLTVILALRWRVSGHIPMSNGFETMMTMSWFSMLLTVIPARRFPLVLPMGFLLCGFSLLVASIGESDPQITHLMPVLSSPLLSVHVACMMLSYTLLGLAMLNSAMSLAGRGLRPGRQGHAKDYDMGRSADLSLVILYPAVFLLAAGTFLGAVWANVSWGRYWAWDPKEVWALITLLVYAFALHGRSLRVFRDPVFFHWFCIIAFLCVIITYFGVNFFLGGLHSYA